MRRKPLFSYRDLCGLLGPLGLGDCRFCAAWGTAKAFRGTIHRMVPPLCLLTCSGRFALFYGGQPPRPRSLLKKAGENFMFCSPLE